MRNGAITLVFVTIALLSGCASTTSAPSASPDYGLSARDSLKARTCAQNGGVWRDNLGVCTGVGAGN